MTSRFTHQGETALRADLTNYEAKLMRDLTHQVSVYGLDAIRSVLDAIEAEQARKTPPKVRWGYMVGQTWLSNPYPEDVRALEAWVADRLRDGDL